MDETKVDSRLAVVETKVGFIAEDIKDIKDNHLKKIYEKIECIIKKMSTQRPSWSVAWIITFLSSATVGLLVLLWKK